MMALDRGGSVTGLAYRLPPGDRLAQIERLLRRETDGLPATNVARWIPLRAGKERITALAVIVDPKGPAYAGHVAPPDVAHVLDRAAGHWGSAATYLQRTVSMLDQHGIRDRNLWQMQKLVATEIIGMASRLDKYPSKR